MKQIEQLKKIDELVQVPHILTLDLVKYLIKHYKTESNDMSHEAL